MKLVNFKKMWSENIASSLQALDQFDGFWQTCERFKIQWLCLGCLVVRSADDPGSNPSCNDFHCYFKSRDHDQIIDTDRGTLNWNAQIVGKEKSPNVICISEVCLYPKCNQKFSFGWVSRTRSFPKMPDTEEEFQRICSPRVHWCKWLLSILSAVF